METRKASQELSTDQRLSDSYEELALDRWLATYPVRAHLLRVVEEAARRAASRARLEDALGQMG